MSSHTSQHQQSQQAGPPQLQPTFYGHIANTMDALLLFEACLQSECYHIPRRPHDRERDALMKSGNVFIYEEASSGIKRWTDGFTWSPSRILGNFLIYRELDKAFPPGEKKRALKRRRSNGAIQKTDTSGRSNSAGFDNNNVANRDADRHLIGSLVESYPFKENGLVKKTISVKWNGVNHHLVSYYSVDDVKSGKLTTPSNDSRLCRTLPRPGLISNQDFRVPVDHEEPIFEGDQRGPVAHYGLAVNMQPSSYAHVSNQNIGRTMSLPALHVPQSLPYNPPGHYPVPHQMPPPMQMSNQYVPGAGPNAYPNPIDHRRNHQSMHMNYQTSFPMMDSNNNNNSSRRHSTQYEASPVTTSAADGVISPLASSINDATRSSMPGSQFFHQSSTPYMGSGTTPRTTLVASDPPIVSRNHPHFDPAGVLSSFSGEWGLNDSHEPSHYISGRPSANPWPASGQNPVGYL